MTKSIDLRVQDNAVESGNVVHVDDPTKDRPRYRVSIYLDGTDVPYVRDVVYHLHKTFPRPKRGVRRTSTNPNCKLTIWTWGIFAIRVQVRMKNGEERWLTHRLTYDQQLQHKGLQLVRTKLSG